MTTEIEHPLRSNPRICSALQKLYDRLRAIGDGTQALRESGLESLRNLVGDRKQLSDPWFEQLPVHVKSACSLFSQGEYLHIPVFLDFCSEVAAIPKWANWRPSCHAACPWSQSQET